MNEFVQICAAILMGIVSVEFFCTSWLGLLGVLASIVMLIRKNVGAGLFLALLNRHLSRCLIFSGLLFIAFKVYLGNFLFGHSELEQLVYLVTVIIAMCRVMKSLPHRVDSLFKKELDEE